MKMLKKALPIAAAALLAASAGLAAVNGSHHDLSTWGSKEEVCLYCHGILSEAQTAGLPYGQIGDLCVTRCHIGAAGFAASDAPIPMRPASFNEDGTTDTANATVDCVNTVDGYGHGLDRMDLFNSFGAGAPLGFDAIGEALPYTDNTGANPMECTSCHNVHDYTYTPFLQADLFTGGPGGESFCEACHAARGNSWIGGETAPNGEHPVNLALVLTDSARTNSERLGRYIALDVTSGGANVFDVNSPNGTALSPSTTNYVTGGKVSGFTPATGGETFGCYTCHSAHMDAQEVLGRTNLILDNAVSAAGGGTYNPLCVGCHGDAATNLDDPNPGLRGAGGPYYYHPVGPTASPIIGALGGGDEATYLTSTGSFEFKVDLTAILSIGLQGAMADPVSGIETTTYKPRCTSCHDVHGGMTNSQALLDFDGTRDGAYTGLVCDACHTGVGLVDVADNTTADIGEVKGTASQGSHHRTRLSSWAAGTIQDADGDDLTMDAASWGGATTTTLGCADCHVFVTDPATDDHFTAHNW